MSDLFLNKMLHCLRKISAEQRRPCVLLDQTEAVRLLDLLNEFDELHASDLRPATKFLSLPMNEHMGKVIEEISEVLEAYPRYLDDPREGPHLAEEIVDSQMALETLFTKLGYDIQARRLKRRQVIQKNTRRKYYEPEKRIGVSLNEAAEPVQRNHSR